MPFLRFIALLLIILAAYFAQYIFDHNTLQQFFPTWILERFPSFSRLLRWLPEDLLMLAFGSSALAAILFGLITPVWPTPQGLTYVAPGQKAERTTSFATGLALCCEMIAFLLFAYVVGGIFVGTGIVTILLAWVASWFFVLIAGWMMNRSRPLQVVAVSSSMPERSWRSLVVILLGASLLYLYRWQELPTQIPEQVANVGIQAQLLLTGAWQSATGATFFPAIPTQPSGFSALVTAATTYLTQDTLLGLRLAGLVVALLLVLATWLVGCELFRRVVRRDEFDEVVDDDGRYLALSAAAIVAIGVGMLHFSRLPLFLEPPAWGALAIWSLLRGLRRADSLNLVLSGLLAGFALVVYPSGLMFTLVTMLVWLGVWLLPGIGFPHSIVVVKRWGWALWLLGLLTVTAPLIGIWMSDGSFAWLQPSMRSQRVVENLVNTLWGFHWKADTSVLVGYPGHLIDSLLAPFLLLAIGGLLLNLDRLPGWLLVVWLGAGIVTASAVSPTAPSWPELLSLLPAVALAIAFAIDRVRSTLIECLGSWIGQAAIYCTVGFVLWVAMTNGLDYLHFAEAGNDPASEIGRFLHSAAPERPIVFVDVANNQEQLWQHPTVQLFQQAATQPPSPLVIHPGDWPEQLPKDSQVLLLPPLDPVILQEIEQRYPEGELQVERSLRGNPLLYIYTAP